jgi:hypothetical protein
MLFRASGAGKYTSSDTMSPVSHALIQFEGGSNEEFGYELRYVLSREQYINVTGAFTQYITIPTDPYVPTDISGRVIYLSDMQLIDLSTITTEGAYIRALDLYSSRIHFFMGGQRLISDSWVPVDTDQLTDCNEKGYWHYTVDDTYYLVTDSSNDYIELIYIAGNWVVTQMNFLNFMQGQMSEDKVAFSAGGHDHSRLDGSKGEFIPGARQITLDMINNYNYYVLDGQYGSGHCYRLDIGVDDITIGLDNLYTGCPVYVIPKSGEVTPGNLIIDGTVIPINGGLSLTIPVNTWVELTRMETDIDGVIVTNSSDPSLVYSYNTDTALAVGTANEITAATLIDMQTDSHAPGSDNQDLSGLVTKATYDAHTILYATTDNNPVALTVGEQTVVGRTTGGNITTLSIDSDLSSVSASDDSIPSAKATKAMGDLKLPLAGGTMTGVINLGENAGLELDSALSADGKYSGVVEAGVAGATLAFGDLVYLQASDSRWELVDANLSAGYDKKLGICVLAAANDGDVTAILLWGKVRADTAFPTMTIGSPVYMSETAGDITSTQPTTADACIRVVGFANTGDELFFNPSNDYIVHA